MGSDFEWGRKRGLWGDDGIPNIKADPITEEEEQETLYKSRDYLTIEEWASQRRTVKKSQKGRELFFYGITVFSKSQTEEESKFNKLNSTANYQIKQSFDSFELAMGYAKKHPGKILKRSSDGDSFLVE